MARWNGVGDRRDALVSAGVCHLGRAAPNGLDPDLMTVSERLEEVGAILAAGLLRLQRRESAMFPAPVTVEPGLAHTQPAAVITPPRRRRGRRSAERAS